MVRAYELGIATTLLGRLELHSLCKTGVTCPIPHYLGGLSDGPHIYGALEIAEFTIFNL